MKIRRKDNHGNEILLPNSSFRTGQGWYVPIFAEFPDDLNIYYLNREWELISHQKEVSMN